METYSLWLKNENKPIIKKKILSYKKNSKTVLVKTLYSGISKGTERLVASGNISKDQFDIMKSPFQEGSFSFPIKYGYINVGKIVEGPKKYLNKNTFCLYPHQSLFKIDINNVNIHLHKMIPIGAGLGGGSSDGAFTLKLLNDIFDLNISNKELERYALQLGADCPFFIDNTPKSIMGIGDVMTSINLDLSMYNLKFVFPNLHISTLDAFRYVTPREPEYDLLDIISSPIANWKGKVKNDFEVSVFQRYPELLEIKEKIYKNI